MSTLSDAFVGGWQFNTNVIIQSGLPFNVSYRDNGADRDTGPNRPDLIGNPDGPQTRAQWFNAAPIGDPNSAFGRPAKGTFGNLPRNALRGPGYWRADASLFKHFTVHQTGDIEIRLEARERPESRKPGKSGFGSRSARESEYQRRPDQFHGIRQCRSAAAVPVRVEVPVLKWSPIVTEVTLQFTEQDQHGERRTEVLPLRASV